MKKVETAGNRAPSTCDVTLVIPQRNHVALTLDCIASICNTDPTPWPILVVDDASDDEERRRLDHADATNRWAVETARHTEHRGVAAAWNTGASRAPTPYVVWLNNDVVADGPWVEQLVGPLRSRALEIVGVAWRTEGAVDRRLLTAHGGGRFLQGWCFAASKRTWEKLGGFDERMAVYWSDTDFFIRARRAGLRLGAVDRLPLRHLGHRTAHDGSCLPDRNVRWRRDRAAFLQKLTATTDGASNIRAGSPSDPAFNV